MRAHPRLLALALAIVATAYLPSFAGGQEADHPSRATESEKVLAALSRSFDLGSGEDLSKITLTTRKAVVAGDCSKNPPARLLAVLVRGRGTVVKTVSCDGERESGEGESSAKEFQSFTEKALSKISADLVARAGLANGEVGEPRSLTAGRTKASARFRRVPNPPAEGAVKAITVNRNSISVTRYGE